MKNPFLSAWLSAANRTAGIARGQMMAQVKKAQTRAIRDATKAWTEAMTGKKTKASRRKGK